MTIIRGFYLKILQILLPARFTPDHANIIWTFINKIILTNNSLYIFPIIFLRLLGRIFFLLNFALTIKAIVAVIRPDLIINILNIILNAYGIKSKIEYADLPYILVGLIIFVNLLGWIAAFLLNKVVYKLHKKILHNPRIFSSNFTLNDDLFLLQKVPILTDSFTRCIDASIFITLLISIIFYLSSSLALLLLPMLFILVFIQILGDRKKLGLIHEKQTAQEKYKFIRNKHGKKTRRTSPDNNPYRQKLFHFTEKITAHNIMKFQFDSFFGTIVLSIVIFYLFQNKTELESMASILIIFVVALRQIVNTSKELSKQLSRLLEFRKDTNYLRKFISD